MDSPPNKRNIADPHETASRELHLWNETRRKAGGRRTVISRDHPAAPASPAVALRSRGFGR